MWKYSLKGFIGCCTAADWTREGEDDFLFINFFYFNYVYIIHSLNYFLFKTEKGKIKVNQLKEWKEFLENKILLIKVCTLFPSVFILTLLLFLTPGKGIIDHIIGIQK